MRFFIDMLGFRLVADRQIPGSQNHWVELAPGMGNVSICLVTWFITMPPGSMRGLVLETENLEEECKTLKTRGLQFDPIQEAPWAKFITFRDPDGNYFVLQQVKRQETISKRVARYQPGAQGAD
jgi:catechol 2,3-dioxygenase-like lactoylglutathione lyase family enzyme